jgi:hypothetical protein
VQSKRVKYAKDDNIKKEKKKIKTKINKKDIFLFFPPFFINRFSSF